MSWSSSIRSIAAGLILLLFTAASASAAEQSASADEPRRIVAVGDIHGDFDAYLTIIEAAGLGDQRGRWKGGDTIFVQTGDIPDRGPDTRKIIDHIRKLQKNASKKGGKVITLIGNHEALNMTGDLRYVHPGEYEAFNERSSKALRAATYDANREAFEAFYLERDPTLSSDAIRARWYEATPLGRLEHQKAWAPEGEIGEWVSENNAVAKIGDTLFLHGGLSAEYAVFSLEEMNERVRTALKDGDTDITSIINDPLGPLWYRGLVRREKPDPADAVPTEETAAAPAPQRPSIPEELDIVLSAYGASRIAVGHTPSLEGIKASQGGRVIQIDTGASKYYGGTRSYLEIIGGKAIAHNVETGETRVLPLEVTP